VFPELLLKNDVFHLLALFLREFLRQFERKAKGLIQVESIQTRNRTRSGKHPFKFFQTLLESGFEPGLLLGEFVPDLITRKSRFAKMLWIRAIERRTFSHAAGVHFTARSEWDEARRLPIPLPDPFVVPNGIDLPPVTSEDRLAGTLLFLGRINWKKGLDCLIDAMKGAPEARAVIAGNDEENLTPKLRAQAERNGVAGRIEFRGPVSGANKETLLRTSTALVLPSHSENFGNVVLEAMAMSMPVIVTPDVGLAADVEQSGSGLVTRNTPEELAAAIRTMLGDPSRRAEMGARGRQLVEERFTWDRVAAQMEEQYARISAAARAGRG